MARRPSGWTVRMHRLLWQVQPGYGSRLSVSSILSGGKRGARGTAEADAKRGETNVARESRGVLAAFSYRRYSL